MSSNLRDIMLTTIPNSRSFRLTFEAHLYESGMRNNSKVQRHPFFAKMRRIGEGDKQDHVVEYRTTCCKESFGAFKF